MWVSRVGVTRVSWPCAVTVRCDREPHIADCGTHPHPPTRPPARLRLQSEHRAKGDRDKDSADLGLAVLRVRQLRHHFDIIILTSFLDHFSRFSQLHATPHAPCTMLY